MTEPVDPELQILREAERRRGGCGAFIVGAVVTLVVFIPLMLLMTFDDRLVKHEIGTPLTSLGLFVGRVAISVACGVGAAKGFTRLRLRLSKKGPK